MRSNEYMLAVIDIYNTNIILLLYTKCNKSFYRYWPVGDESLLVSYVCTLRSGNVCGLYGSWVRIPTKPDA